MDQTNKEDQNTTGINYKESNPLQELPNTNPLDSSDMPTESQIPEETIDRQYESSENVVVSPPEKKTPGWFLALFILVLLLFIIVSALLAYQQFYQKKGNSKSISPTSTPNPNVSIYVSPTFVPIPTPTIDTVVSKLNSLTGDDSLENIEKDIENTDLSELEKEVNKME